MGNTLSLKHLREERAQGVRSAGWIAYSVILSLLCACYAEFVYELSAADKLGIESGIFFHSVTMGSLVRVFVFALVVLFVLFVLTAFERVADWLFDHRHILAVGLLALLVLFEISGSSISIWGQYLGEPRYQGVLYGTPRIIRSDEWMVSTPFAYAQSMAGAPAVSNVIRGTTTDMTMVSAQPAWCLAALFRPLYWGYLILGPTRGLSFFWCTRAIVLVVTAFDCMLLLTKGNRRIAAFGAIAIGLSPLIEWWSLGGSDILIYGQGLVLALHHLLRAKTLPGQITAALVLAWLLGCFALTLYPTWQIPMVYVFGAFGIADVVAWFKETTKNERIATAKHCVVPLVLFVAAVLACVVISVRQSWDVFQITANTDYPGLRISTGGGLAEYLGNPSLSIISPLWPYDFSFNVCENAGFLSLFPLGLILSVILLVQSIRNGKSKSWLLALLIPYAFFLLFGFIGFPEALARLTLMSSVTTIRLQLALGYLDVAMLVHAVTLIQARDEASDAHARLTGTRGVLIAIGVAIVFACLVTALGVFIMPQFANFKAMLIMVAVIVVLAVPILLPKSAFEACKLPRDRWVLASAAIVFVIGMSINPVQKGADVISESPTINKLSELASQEENPLWLTDDRIYGQACVLAGIPTITSVNTYPDIERWAVFDPDGSNRYAYNRYAHIIMLIGDEVKFENPNDDALQITLPADEIPKLGATHWLSAQDLPAWNTENVQFVPQDTVGGMTLYKIETTDS